MDFNISGPPSPGGVLRGSSSHIKVAVEAVLELPLGLLPPSQTVHLGKARVEVNILDPGCPLKELFRAYLTLYVDIVYSSTFNCSSLESWAKSSVDKS